MKDWAATQKDVLVPCKNKEADRKKIIDKEKLNRELYIQQRVNEKQMKFQHQQQKDREETLYNNYSKTRNLIGQYPCRMRQSCTGNLKVDIASHFTSLLRACYELKIADKKTISTSEISRE